MQKTQVIRRLEALDLTYNHPLLIPGLLAELERIRLFGLIDKLLDNFTLRAWIDRELDLDINKAKLTSFLQLCFESRELINQIQAVKKQLSKMSVEIIKFKDLTTQPVDDPLALESERLRCAGELISAQLEEISTEFDDKINDCSVIIDNMSLTMQTVSCILLYSR